MVRAAKPSFAEQLHGTILTAATPADALAGVIGVVEGEIASAGAFLYRFPRANDVELLCGSLTRSVTGDRWWWEDDPCQLRGPQVDDEPLVHATDIVPRRRFTRSSAYRIWYGPNGVEHVVCLKVNGRRQASAGMVGLFLGRPGAANFRPRDKRQLLMLRPVLAALLHLRDRSEELDRLLDGATVSLRDVRPVVMFSAAGEHLWSSPRAHAVLGGEPARDQFFAAARRAIVQLAPRKLFSGTGPRELPVTLGRWALEVEPHCTRTGERLFVGRLVPAENVEARVARRYTLTPTEAAVLSCLGRGMSNADIHQELEMSESTVATHVKHVLRKLGVASRLQAGLLMQRIELRDQLDD